MKLTPRQARWSLWVLQGSTKANKIRVGRRLVSTLAQVETAEKDDMRALATRSKHKAGQEPSELRASHRKQTMTTRHAGLASKSLHLAVQDNPPETLPSLTSRFKRDRIALRHRFKRCASKMVSQAWALNLWAWRLEQLLLHLQRGDDQMGSTGEVEVSHAGDNL